MQRLRKHFGFVLVLSCFVVSGFVFWGCQLAYSNGAGETVPKKNTPPTTNTKSTSAWTHNMNQQLPAKADRGAAAGFWKHWGDGKGELTGYKGKVSRYGQLRDATAALIYVTEPMDRRTWIKDDSVTGQNRVPVLKLNYALKFMTGIYPYSVMTSVFTAVGQWRKQTFPPVKVTLSAQEWCGHVFHGLWPGETQATSKVMSYFASEGEKAEQIKVSKETLYEDALMIQLRELDGAFAQGKDWKGSLLPSLWATRRAHRNLRPVSATITRKTITENKNKIHRFTLKYANVTRVYDVEASGARRILRWSSNDGEDMRLQKTKRLAYWGLSGPSGQTYRKEIGLD